METLNSMPIDDDDEQLTDESDNSIQCECNTSSSTTCRRNETKKTSNSSTSRNERFKELQRRRLQLKARTEGLEMKREVRKRKRYERKQAATAEQDVLMDTSTSNTEAESKFAAVKKYLDVNAHLTGAVCHNIHEPKSHMEEKVNDAIEQLDFETAEQLSDNLAQRDFACRLHEAFEAKKFADAKEKEDAIIKAKKQKKLHWGFDAKQRWEMKGNL